MYNISITVNCTIKAWLSCVLTVNSENVTVLYDCKHGHTQSVTMAVPAPVYNYFPHLYISRNTFMFFTFVKNIITIKTFCLLLNIYTTHTIYTYNILIYTL